MKIKNRYKYLVTLFVAILVLSVVKLRPIEATTNKELTVETDLASIPMPEEQPEEDPVTRANVIMSWDLTKFKNLTEWNSIFANEDEIVTPIPAKYSFNLSVTPETYFEGATLNEKYPDAGHVVLNDMNPGDSFTVKNAGFYKGESLDVIVRIDDMDYNSPVQNDPDYTLNLMFNNNYFGGVNLLGRTGASSAMLELTYTTVNSKTGELVYPSGILPYNNIMLSNLVTLDKELIETIYGPLNSVIKYQEELVGDGTVSFSSNEPGVTSGGTIAAISPERRLAVQYDGVASRKFRIDLPSTTGFVMDPRSPVPIALTEPFVSGNVYDAGEEDMFYQIDQDIPLEPYAYNSLATAEAEEEARKFLFKDFNIEIPLNEAISKVNENQITVETDRGVKLKLGEDFELESTEANGRETLNLKILEKFRHGGTGNNMGMDFYGRRMIVKIPVTLDPTADLTPYVTDDEQLIRVPLNEVKTKIDDFYQTVVGNEGFAEATNIGSLTLTHLDDKGNKIREDIAATGVLGKPWEGKYDTTGGYVKDEIFLGDEAVDEIIFKWLINTYKMTFKDERFDFGMTASSPEDPTGETVKQKEELTYTLGITSRAAQSDLTDYLNHYESIKVTLDDYDTALLNNPEVGELKLGETVLATASYDESTNSYNFVGLDPDVLWSDNLKLVFKATTKEEAAIGQKISMKSSVALTFKDGDGSGEIALPFSGQTKALETEIVEKSLMFESHPTDIDFGVIKRATFGGVKTYPIQSMNDDLVIRDERTVNVTNGWRLSARLTQEFTIAGTTNSLPGILKYIDQDGKIETLVADNQTSVLIHKQATTTEPLTNVSGDWQKDNRGLVLQLFSGDAEVEKDYTAVIEWQLEDGL